MADLLNDNSIFYTTCNGCKYPITIIGEDRGLKNKDELPEVLCLLEAYRESLKGGVEIISHTYNNDMGEIRFDHPLRTILYALFSNYGSHDCHLDSLWLPASITEINECFLGDERNVTLYLRAKIPPRIIGDLEEELGMWEYFDNEDVFKVIYVPKESIMLYKFHPVWGHYHSDKIVGYDFNELNNI